PCPVPRDWYDNLCLSADAPFDDGDVFVGSQYGFHSLGAGASYSASGSFTLPSAPDGAAYLLVVADGDNYQRESDETNNAFAVPIDLTGPDLVITTASGPSSAAAGQVIPLSCPITNHASPPTTTYSSDLAY